MLWAAQITEPKPLRCVIEQQTLHSLIPNQPDQLAFYLYVFEATGISYDYLQDTLEIAKRFAFEKFQVPISAWQQVEPT